MTVGLTVSFSFSVLAFPLSLLVISEFIFKVYSYLINWIKIYFYYYNVDYIQINLSLKISF